MDLMLSFSYIYLALNMSMLVTDCIEFISHFFLFHVLFSPRTDQGFLFEREVTTLKHLCGMAV